jgi:hypothetical protein
VKVCTTRESMGRREAPLRHEDGREVSHEGMHNEGTDGLHAGKARVNVLGTSK